MIDQRKAEAEKRGPEGKEVRKRSKTLSRKEMAREMRRMRALGEIPPDEQELRARIEKMRPKTRADCVNAPRPCLFVSCKYNLFLDVNPRTGSVKLNFPDKEIWELAETCVLDVADRGGITLEEVGRIMNLTRERIRQVETHGLKTLAEQLDIEPAPPRKSRLPVMEERGEEHEEGAGQDDP